MYRQIPALTVKQWLPSWESVEFDESRQRRRPPERFFLFSIQASELRLLTDIQRREAKDGRPRASDYKIQRSLDPERSNEIAEFVKYGFPWSKLSTRQRQQDKFANLTMPGWLPTSIVVNILLPEDEREGKTVDPSDLVTVDAKKSTTTINVPNTQATDWALSGLAPIEVIDGQHRLWAFEEDVEDFEVPVVAFLGLDRTWQAYLFYTINISPKKINASLAFDLYPLLRTEDWLEQFEGHIVYRETRAQELTEALWSFEGSPWFHRINMLGVRGEGNVSQASWIRNLISTFVKSWEGRGVKIGGLFGAPVGKNELTLPWNRAQQAAFLILAWDLLAAAIRDTNPEWAQALDGHPELLPNHSGILSSNSMLNSDMGVRGFLHILNDLAYLKASDLKLHEWSMPPGPPATSDEAIEEAMEELRKLPGGSFLSEVAAVLSTYDWRSSKAPGLEDEERRLKARFRGSGGYRELRGDLLAHVTASDGELQEAAIRIREILKL